ncbi:MAG: lysostaphin resistance A-like protein [Vagococcus sp.]
MTLNKSTLWTSFFFLFALNSRPLLQRVIVTDTAIINGMALFDVIGACCIALIYVKTDKRETMSSGRALTVRALVTGILGLLMSVCLQVLLSLIEVKIFHQNVASENTQFMTDMVRQSPFFIVAVGVAGPIMEEFVFRFSLINWLNQWFNSWVSALISSVLFAVMHGDGHYLLYGGLSMCFYLLYRSTGSIVTPIVAHSGMNILGIMMQG